VRPLTSWLRQISASASTPSSPRLGIAGRRLWEGHGVNLRKAGAEAAFIPIEDFNAESVE